jgi:hypothetical protein
VDNKSNPHVEHISFSIAEFCARNGISLSYYHKLKRDRRGPAEMRLGALMIRITADSEREWHQAMSNPTGDEADKRAQMEDRAAGAGRRLSVLSAEHPANVKRARRNMHSSAQEFAAARGRKTKQTA